MQQSPRTNIRVEWPGGRRPRRTSSDQSDLICLSHLRWRFVFQRPQHLMTRAARDRRVFFFEEPVESTGAARLVVEREPGGVFVAVPHLPAGLEPAESWRLQRALLDLLITDAGSAEFVFWYWTPMALNFTRAFDPLAVAFDCMDELSAFAFAPRELLDLEAELLSRADLVFTGGRSLYEAKRHRHKDVHLFPSSVEVAHFAAARSGLADPPDQADIPHPRLGFYGVIDERMDLDLLNGLADRRPDWHLVLVGPTAKIDPAQLPRRPNLHLIGQRSYAELPSYLAGWDVALLPFARNDATRFISPTKTPEYLAAGRPVVSTSIRDVVSPYGERGFVRIADSLEDFIAAIEAALTDARDRLSEADAFLADQSWDRTWQQMAGLIDALVAERAVPAVRRSPLRMPAALAADRPQPPRGSGNSPARTRT